MIENRKPEIVEEEETSEESNRKFFKTGIIIIGSILFLMVTCLITIFILENV